MGVRSKPITLFHMDSSPGISTAAINPKWEPTVRGSDTIPSVLKGTLWRNRAVF